MVATMSRIRLPRERVRAAISAPSPTTTRSSGASGTIRSSSMPITSEPLQRSTLRLDWRGAVEGCGGRRAPVDHQGLVLVVADAEATDISSLAVGSAGLVVGVGPEIQPSEHEAFVLRLQDRASLVRVEHQGIALEESGDLLVADIAGAVGSPAGKAFGLHQRDALGGLGELGVDLVHVLLLDGDLSRNGVLGHARAAAWRSVDPLLGLAH